MYLYVGKAGYADKRAFHLVNGDVHILNPYFYNWDVF